MEREQVETYRFKMGDAVVITVSGEAGHVIGRAEYAEATPSYLVRYLRKDGSGSDSWWSEGALSRPAA